MLRSLKWLYHLLVAICAALWFRMPARKLIVVGVTGTDGKTTTTSLIYEILKLSGYKVSMITSVNAVIAGVPYDTGFHVTTPTAWWVQKYLREAVNHGDTHMVLEVTSHGLAQNRVFGISFAVGVLTNITHEHLDWHRSFDDYVKTKLMLLKSASAAVLNRDDAVIYAKAVERLRNKKLVLYAIRRDALITPKTYPFITKLPGEFNRYNCLAALAATYALGVPKKKALSAIARFRGVPGRMEVIVRKPYVVIVDFAHTPNALIQALRTVRKLAKKRLIHVFGSAGLRDHSKRPLMGKASSSYADIIVLTEEDYRTEDVNIIMDELTAGIESGKEVHRIVNRQEAIVYAMKIARPGDVIMITGKGHEKSLCRGTTEYPWSDQEEVRKNLQLLVNT
ncbi:UDP-N-acetylmuramyl-tripeptide synthetase [Candidatus Gottesmanbacteria bacterium]|nr:UDP-N-acetylmuramyl-tripeptide synthetase [Candidatus Gottesmanbacteria bacterium]